MVAAKLANLHAGDNYHSRQTEVGQICLTGIEETRPTPVTVTDAAALLNVSPRSVKAGRAVREDGVPELATAVEAGEFSVSAAAEVAKLPRGSSSPA